jgi:type IV pilus assembly protein PilA
MKKQSGFTLIELLLVLAIIGIISAIAIPAILSQRDNARDKSALSNCTNIIASFVSEWDLLVDAPPASGLPNTPTTFETYMWGTAGSERIIELTNARNPWNPAAGDTGKGYRMVATAETTTAGTQAITAASAGDKGAVYVSFGTGVGANSDTVVAAAVKLNKAQAGADATSKVFCKPQGLG